MDGLWQIHHGPSSRTDQPLATWVDQLKEPVESSEKTTVVVKPGSVAVVSPVSPVSLVILVIVSVGMWILHESI